MDSLDPAEYTTVGDSLEWALGILEDEPATELAPLVGMSEKRFRDVRRRISAPNELHREAIIELARKRAGASGAPAP